MKNTLAERLVKLVIQKKKKKEKVFNLKIDIKKDWGRHMLRISSSSYRKIFNFCLEKMINSLNAISANLFWNEHESVTYSKLDYELYEAVNKKNYGNLRSYYQSLPKSVIDNAIIDSIGYFNKWKRERINSKETIHFPQGISKSDLRSFVIGSNRNLITFSSKGLYLPKCGRFYVLNSKDEDAKKFKGLYKRAKVFYQNEDCTWYCQLELKNKQYL